MYIIVSLLIQVSWSFNVEKYLIKYGYLDTSEENAITDIENSLINFQEFYQLELEGTSNDETLALMNKPHCGIPDFPMPFTNFKKWN